MHAAELVVHTLRLGGGSAAASCAEQWRDARTTGVPRLVVFEGCALWLERRLRQLGVAEVVEPGFAGWLRQRAHTEVAQNLLVDAQIEAVAARLAEWGVPHVFLKGAARRAAAELYPFADARATHDVDVLVPAHAARTVWERLRLAGYEPALPPDETPPEHHHLPALWDRTRVAVEVHCSTAPAVPPEVAWARTSAGACDVARSGSPLWVPSATELLWSGLTHSLRHRANGFRLHFLLDGAAVWASQRPIDWEEIARRLAGGEAGRRRRAGAWLGAAAWLARADRPRAIADALRPFDVPAAVRGRWALLRRFGAEGRMGELVCWWTNVWGGRLASRRQAAPHMWQAHQTHAVRLALQHPEAGRTLPHE